MTPEARPRLAALIFEHGHRVALRAGDGGPRLSNRTARPANPDGSRYLSGASETALSITYSPAQPTIGELIADATRNPTVLVPDLQRSFVWGPREVRDLVDSILRGWPFGTLLLWELKPAYYGSGEGIPSRPFWRDVVDRTIRPISPPSHLVNPQVYRMVLDGQQRLQSLVIAFGEHACGFRLLDHEWVLDLENRRRDHTKNSSRGVLCVDLTAFEDELAAKNMVLRRMEFASFLKWVAMSKDQQTDKGDTNRTLPRAWLEPGRYIRLSRLWDLAEGALPEDEYRANLEGFLPTLEVSASVVERLAAPLAVFMRQIAHVKANTRAHCLQIESVTVTKTWTRDDYNDAIVNIFTRLNTAGRTLSREEVTMAWLKVGWQASVETGDRQATECLGELHQGFAARGLVGEAEPSDAVVRTLTFFWSVYERDGKLLTDRDLMNGAMIQPMAADVSRSWLLIERSLRSSLRRLKLRAFERKVTSVNALIVAWCWKYLADAWLDAHQLRVKPEHNYEATIHELYGPFMDRWQFASQWSNVWATNAVENFRSFAMILHGAARRLRECSAPDAAIDVLRGAITELMAQVEPDAETHIRRHAVTSRSRVSAYHSELWIWHRLDEKRAEYSDIGLRHRNTWRELHPQVDHTIAHALWIKRVAAELDAMPEATAGAASEPAPGPSPFETRVAAEQFINALGNCALLRADFNTSKQAAPLASFLQDVKEFIDGKITIEQWCAAFAMAPILAAPTTAGFQEIVDAVRERDARIRSDLIEFVRGRLVRKDIPATEE